VRTAPLVFLLFLAACQRPADTQPPLIGITQPQGGVMSQRSFTVSGYVLDDSGVQSIKANGNTELLAPAQKGHKLVNFRFRSQATQSGEVELKVVATDVKGQTRTLVLPLVLDARPPTIEIERIERQVDIIKKPKPKEEQKPELGPNDPENVVEEEKITLKVSGKVLDDTSVEKVVIEQGGRYSILSLPKGKQVSFYYELPPDRASLIAIDVAGNRSSKAIR
jgi:hypothetical protein